MSTNYSLLFYLEKPKNYLEIIGRYADYPPCVAKGLVLPVLSNQKMNSYLKEIADLCGITKKLTFHMARHTFATTVTLANNVPIETVSKMLGHTDIKTTQHYAKLLDTRIGSDMEALQKRLARMRPKIIHIFTCVQPSKTMKQKDDYLWKGILEDVFDDFLRFLHPDADKVFDLSRGITFLDKELEQLFPPEDDEFAPKVVDKLAQVYTHDGIEEWILIHVEVQGTYRRDFSLRMFTYYYRILDKYHKRISAYAILTEASKKPRPNTYEEEFMGTGISYRFNMYKIAEQDTNRLLASDNPFALVVLTAKAAFVGKNLNDKDESDKALLQTKIQLARELLERNMSKEKIRGLMNFLRYYVPGLTPKNRRFSI